MSKVSETDGSAAQIFTVGGTVQAGGGMYIPREADLQLLELCRAGTFTYVLTPRQMGKSSLMVRTAEQLNSEGVSTVVIDLTAFGTLVDADQWYLSLLTQVEDQLSLDTDAIAWWAEHTRQGAVERMTLFFRDVVLKEVTGRVVIFIDEIDTTLLLPFTDDFYAAIRSLYLMRAQNHEFKRLSFVLIGVATPSDLIKDPKRTPFNVGQRVDLTDFTTEEARPLAEGLGLPPDETRRLHDLVMGWTGGHPFLTQRLYGALAERGRREWSEAEVDAVVAETFFGERSEQDSNLRTVRDMLTKRAADTEAVLETYLAVLHGKRPVPDDEQSLVKSHLKLSGIVRREDGVLKVRNRIYASAFDERWVRAHLPVNWPKRLARIAAIAVIAFMALCVPLSAIATYQWRQATEQTAIAKQQTALANERLAEVLKQQKIIEGARAEAEKRRLEAETERDKATGARAEAEDARAEAEKRRVEAENQREAAEAATAEAKRSATALEASASKLKATMSRLDESLKYSQALTQSQRASKLQQAALLVDGLMNEQDSYALDAYDVLNKALRLLPRRVDALSYKQPANNVAYSPDGRFMLTAYDDGAWASSGTTATPTPTPGATPAAVNSLVVRDVATGKEASRLKLGANDALRKLAFSPDGGYVVGHVVPVKPGGASTAADEALRVWKLGEDGQLTPAATDIRMPHLTYSYGKIAVGPGGKYVAADKGYVAAKRVVVVYDVATGAEAFSIECPDTPNTVVFSERGGLIAIATSSYNTSGGKMQAYGLVQIFAIKDGRADRVKSFTYEGRVTTVALNRDGDLLAAGGADGTTLVWRVPSRAEAAAQPTPTPAGDGKSIDESSATAEQALVTVRQDGPVMSIAFSRDGRFLATAGTDDTARVWSLFGSYAREAARAVQEDDVTAVAFDPKGRYFTTVAADNTIRTWEMPNGPRDINTVVVEDDTGGGALSVNRQYVILRSQTAGGDEEPHETAEVKDLSRGVVSQLPSVGEDEQTMAVSEDGKLVATLSRAGATSNDYVLRVRAVEDEKVMFSAPLEERVVYGVFSPDGRYFAAATSSVYVWDLAQKKKLYKKELASLDQFAFSPDGAYCVAVAENEVRVWETRGGEDIKADWPKGLTASNRTMGVLDFSVSEGLLAVSTRNGLEVVRFPSGGKVATIQEKDEIDSMDISPEGEYLAYATQNSAHVLSLKGGAVKELKTITEEDEVVWVDLSGHYLAETAGNAVHIWDILEGCEVARLEAEGIVGGAFFVDGGNALVMGESNNTLYKRSWKPKALLAEVCLRVTRNISLDEWSNQYLLQGMPPMTCDSLPQNTEKRARAECRPTLK